MKLANFNYLQWQANLEVDDYAWKCVKKSRAILALLVSG